MSLRVTILGSSSAGNCGLLQADRHCFLIDAGFSRKQIALKLQTLGVDLDALSGIFITHEHSDHVRGLSPLSKIPGIRFYANIKTQQAIEAHKPLAVDWQNFGTDSLTIEGLEVCPFGIQHDAVDPVGFRFNYQGECVTWALDVGRITDTLIPHLTQANTLVMESNHDTDLLWHSERSMALKTRITEAHLSNNDTFSFLKKYQEQANWKEIYLAHISQECNSQQCLKEAIEAAHLTPTVHIVRPCKSGWVG